MPGGALGAGGEAAVPPRIRSAGARLTSEATRPAMPTGGAVRVSLGLAPNFADVHRFMRFAPQFLDVTDVPGSLPPRLAC